MSSLWAAQANDNKRTARAKEGMRTTE